MRESLSDAVAMLEARGHLVEVAATGGAGDGVRIARESAAAGWDVVAAAGGDGTVNEVVNGLAGTDAVMAVLPLGTENIFAKEIGIPTTLKDACAVILDGKPGRLDLGKVRGRYFISMAGIGMDAEVVATVEKEAKGLLGSFAYALTAFRLLSKYRGFKARITVDGRRIKASTWLVLVSNIRTYGWRLQITPEAKPDDGQLDMCIFRKDSFSRQLLQIGRIFVGLHRTSPEVRFERGAALTVETKPAVRVHVDGEECGATPVTITTHPAALSVMLPG